MKITKLRLIDFRNFEDQEIEVSEGTNLFYGDNAQGKTNILEAAFLCGTTKSHRGSKDGEMIRFGREEAHIRMEVEKREVGYRIDMHLKKNLKKGIAVNQVPIRKANELMGICHFVFFSPEDLNIIKNGPSERRRFMDLELCQLSTVYLQELSIYNRALAQRNKLLKDYYTGSVEDFEGMLDVWDEQLLKSGRSIIRMRDSFIARLSEVMRRTHDRLSGGREVMNVGYEKNVPEEEFEQELKKNRERDLRMKMTHAGPHRDDLIFSVGGIDIRRFGSQGQQRTTALSLKLSEIELVNDMTGDRPVLLLDDVLSELDRGRQQFLLESIHRTQTLITCTGVEEYRKGHFQIDRLFYVENGTCMVQNGG